MQHLNLFYLFLTSAVGSVSLSIAAFIYIKTRQKLARSYLLFYSVFTLLVLSEALNTYLTTNMTGFSQERLLFYYIAPIGFFMLFAATSFMHEVLLVPRAKMRNAVMGALVGFMVLQHFLLGVLQNSAVKRGAALPLAWWSYLVYAITVIVIVYMFVISLKYQKQLHDPSRKQFLRQNAVLYGLAILATFIDTFFRESFPLRLFPLFYCFMSVTFTRHFLKLSFHHEAPPEPSVSENASSNEPAHIRNAAAELFRRYDISPRERDIIDLILQGHTYQKTGETLFISTNTVKTHISNIYAKCGVKSRYELMVLFKEGSQA